MANTGLKLLIGLARTVNTINNETNRILSTYNLTLGQFAVLEAITTKGPLTIGEIQRKILSSSGTMPVIINNLLRRGYITKTQDSTDKRKFYIEATAEGEKLLREVFPKNKDMIENYMSCWSQEEQQQLLQLMKKFRVAHKDLD